MVTAPNTFESRAMDENERRAYEAGVRDGELRSLHERVSTMDRETKAGFLEMTREIGALKKAIWMLYGAIALMGFIVPLMQKWAALG
jgi:hypothetical protein